MACHRLRSPRGRGCLFVLWQEVCGVHAQSGNIDIGILGSCRVAAVETLCGRDVAMQSRLSTEVRTVVECSWKKEEFRWRSPRCTLIQPRASLQRCRVQSDSCTYDGPLIIARNSRRV